jgi:hypothetical protein
VERCYSSTYYLLAGLASEIRGNVARIMIKVQTLDHQQLLVKANADTGGSRNLSSRHLLQNIKAAEEYGGKPISMTTIHGDSPRTHTKANYTSPTRTGFPLSCSATFKKSQFQVTKISC